MSRFSPRASSLSSSRLERLRRGVVLALLALFSQTVVALLPMPAMESGPERTVLCGTADGQGSGKPQPTKAPAHSLPDCLACQAVHLGANLVPAAPIAVAAQESGPGWRPAPMVAAALLAVVFRPHQARAPPTSV